MVSVSLLCTAVAFCFVETNRQLQIVEIIGVCLCTSFYGAYCVWEIRDPTPGLVIDCEGIVDDVGLHASPSDSVERKISSFRMFDFFGTPYVMVDLVDHQKFIQKRGWQRSSAKLASEVAGSPLGFTGESIGLTPDELFRVFSNARHKFRHRPGKNTTLTNIRNDAAQNGVTGIFTEANEGNEEIRCHFFFVSFGCLLLVPAFLQ